MGAAVRRGADFAPAERLDEAPNPNAASVIGSDPPEHTRLRNIVNRGFTPRRIAALEGRVREIASRLAERFISAGECDLVADYAVPLPVTVIAELLGVDPDRVQDFKRWSDAMIRVAFDTPSEEEGAHITQCLVEVNDYLETVMAACRECPAGDLISTLVHAEAIDGTLTSDELKIFVFTLLAAGNVTTTNLVANATRALLEHLAELAKVSADPSLIPSLVEEALRYDAPVQLLLRTASRDVELAGVTILAGGGGAGRVRRSRWPGRGVPRRRRLPRRTATRPSSAGSSTPGRVSIPPSSRRTSARTACTTMCPCNQ